jgi:hypothetical protein
VVFSHLVVARTKLTELLVEVNLVSPTSEYIDGGGSLDEPTSGSLPHHQDCTEGVPDGAGVDVLGVTMAMRCVMYCARCCTSGSANALS